MDKIEKKKLRREFSSLGTALILYMVIMNLCVFAVCLLEVFGKVLVLVSREGVNALLYRLPDLFFDSLTGNGWGYVVAILMGLLFLRLWKGKDLLRKEIWVSRWDMTPGSFFSILTVFLSCQALFLFLANLQEFFLNLFGLSAVYSIEAATFTADTFSLFLYAGILAPISEEILFRGFILRALEPHGKRFAIVLSAFLFGMFHGNLVQSPFAFLVGIVLGYTALEYNILWAMVLHTINNLVLSDMFYRIFPAETADIITTVLVLLCFLAAVIICILRRKEIREYFRENPISNSKTGLFFRSAGIILMIILMEISALTGLTRI